MSGCIVDISAVNLQLLAALRANAFWGHDGEPFSFSIDRDRWAHEVACQYTCFVSERSSLETINLLGRLVKNLHADASRELLSSDGDRRDAMRSLREVTHYIELAEDNQNVYFDNETAIISLVTAMRHIAAAMKDFGLWQWVYRHSNIHATWVVTD